jgi:hypothetical protein
MGKKKQTQGVGLKYSAGLKVYQVSSRGRKHRVMGQKVKREYHFFSDLEFFFFCIFDFCDPVSDIREQYELPLKDTQRISAEKGIKHPRIPRTTKPKKFTTDLVVTINGKIIACAVKPASMMNKRTLLKLEIERAWWQERRVTWYLLTDKELDMTLFSNLWELREHYEPSVEESVSEFLRFFKKKMAGANCVIEVFLEQAAAAMKVDKAITVQLFKHALSRKYIKFDYTIPLDLSSMVVSDFFLPN